MSDSQIRIEGGNVGQVHLTLVAKASLHLVPAVPAPTSLSSMVTLSGTSENLPDKTPVTFAWMVQRESGTGSGTVGEPPHYDLKVTGKTQASLTVCLDVISVGMFGKGVLGFSATPMFPHAKPQTVPPEPGDSGIPFNLPIFVEFGVPFGCRIGSVVSVKLTRAGVFDDSFVKVSILYRGQSPTALDEFVWAPKDHTDKPWRVGVSGTGQVLEYLNVDATARNEVCSFDWVLSIARTEKGHYVEIARSKNPFVSVSRPKLQSFDFVREGAWFLESWVGNRHVLRARGAVTGFDPKVAVQVLVKPFMTDPDSKEKVPVGSELPAFLDAGGNFDVVLADIGKETGQTLIAKYARAEFFAVLRFPSLFCGTTDDKPMAIRKVIQCDTAKFATWPEEALISKATGVCTLGQVKSWLPDGSWLPERGKAAKLCDADFDNAARELGCETAVIRAVADVEAGRPDGFDNKGRPVILFEAHIFHSKTHGKYDGEHPTLSQPEWNKKCREYYKLDQWDRLKQAMALAEEEALMSASWGMFQVMGFNYACGPWKSVKEFVLAMFESEANHMKAFLGYCKTRNLTRYLVRKEWAKFAAGYNGSSYEENAYDKKLAAAYAKHK